jgi:hypothetical protein
MKPLAWPLALAGCVVLVGLSLVVAGCSNAGTLCDMMDRPPPGKVVVVDKATGERICDANVTATSYQAGPRKLEASSDPGGCTYYVGANVGGTWRFDAKRDGFQDAFTIFDVPSNECNLLDFTATIEMVKLLS